MTFNFNKNTHTYTLDGKRLTGVTTVLGIISKPQLIPCAARMATEYIKESKVWKLVPNTPRMIMIGDKELDELLEQARKAHTRKKDKAAGEGTDVHLWLERWIKGDMQELPKDLIANKQVSQFIGWAKENNVEFLASEKKVYRGDNKWYAGTLDFIVKIGDNVFVGDIKTSSGIYDKTFFAQCAAYRYALEYCEPDSAKNIKGSVIVRMGKDGSFEEKYSYDYETDLSIFLAALTIYRGNETYQSNKRGKSS